MREARFRDRAEAGRILGERLGRYAGRDDVVVLALPRGGVPVGRQVARALGAPLDVFLVRKLGLPGQPELAMGAIATGGTRVLNEELFRELRVPEGTIERVAEQEGAELERRERAYRGDRPPPDIEGKAVILVDDGLATGSTMRAAVAALRPRTAEVVVAVPAAPPQALAALAGEVDDVVAVVARDPFYAVGFWYEDFREVRDEDVRRLLALPPEEQVSMASGEDVIRAGLLVPQGAHGLVVFAHGSGSSRFSPRNRYVAGVLEEAGFATLLVDLLTASEERVDLRTRELRFDVGLLSDRLLTAAVWAAQDDRTTGLPVGFFGASTGAAAALVAAARLGEAVRAVVSRGGRPDLAGAALRQVAAPTLLIVGALDEAVLDLNRQAKAAMTVHAELEVVRGATHLFEERGALERVAALARAWFEQSL